MLSTCCIEYVRGNGIRFGAWAVFRGIWFSDQALSWNFGIEIFTTIGVEDGEDFQKMDYSTLPHHLHSPPPFSRKILERIRGESYSFYDESWPLRAPSEHHSVLADRPAYKR